MWESNREDHRDCEERAKTVEKLNKVEVIEYITKQAIEQCVYISGTGQGEPYFWIIPVIGQENWDVFHEISPNLSNAPGLFLHLYHAQTANNKGIEPYIPT